MLAPLLTALGLQGADLGLVESIEPPAQDTKDARVNNAVRITHAERRRARDLCSGCAPSRAELPCLERRAKGERQADTSYDDPSTGLDPRAVALSLTEGQARAVFDARKAFLTSLATP